MKETAIYARVSTNRQDLASQLPDLERWITANDAHVEWYRDKFTGKTMERKGWDQLMADVRAGKVSRIVVWRLDRLGRTAKGLTALFEELIERKVNLTSLRDGIDLNTPAGRLMANVLASVAQYETEVRAERVAAGQAVARSRGKRWGGSPAGCFLKVSPEQFETIQRFAAEGQKISRIARIMGLSRPTVYRVIASQKHTVRARRRDQVSTAASECA